MNEVATLPSVTETAGKSPSPAGVKSAIAETLHKDEQTIAGLQAQIVKLAAQLANGGKPEKRACNDDAFNAAVATLVAQGKEDLASANPRATPNVSLLSVLEFIPDMTKEQRASWKPVKARLELDYSNFHRTQVAHVKTVISRVLRNPNGKVATVNRTRKDGTVSRAALAVKEPAKRKPGKGLKKAKPAQIAGKVPAAGNAANPATVS